MAEWYGTLLEVQRHSGILVLSCTRFGILGKLIQPVGVPGTLFLKVGLIPPFQVSVVNSCGKKRENTLYTIKDAV